MIDTLSFVAGFLLASAVYLYWAWKTVKKQAYAEFTIGVYGSVLVDSLGQDRALRLVNAKIAEVQKKANET